MNVGRPRAFQECFSWQPSIEMAKALLLKTVKMQRLKVILFCQYLKVVRKNKQFGINSIEGRV